MNTKLEALKARLLRRADSRKAYSGVSREHWHNVDRHSFWGGGVWKLNGTSWHVRVADKPEDHLRSIEAAHKILNLDHTGWWTTFDGSGDTTQGLALYAGHGKWFAACSDPWNFNDKTLTGQVIIECCKDGQPVIYDNKEDAASTGDTLARIYGEICQEDDVKNAANQCVESEQENIASARSTFATLADELRTVALPPAICDAMRARLRTLRESVRQSVARINELRDNPHSVLS